MNKTDTKRKRFNTGRPQHKKNKKQKLNDASKEEVKSEQEDEDFDVKVEQSGDKGKKPSNDVNEGCTVFIKNVHFDASDEELRKICSRYGQLHYAIINREPISGHSRGTAFVKFKTKESADLCLLAGDELSLKDEVLQTFTALSREEVHRREQQDKNDDTVTDSRNLYLAREGLIMAGSKAADGLSASDMTKRHKLEKIKTQVLKNLNRFVSRNRLSIHNLPLTYDDGNLKRLVIAYTGFKPHECRVMRENKIMPGHPNGQSKGFGFMSFNTHKEALVALRKLNNNPKIFGDVHRPIVAFSIEDRAVHKIKEKRLQKSQLNNPTFQQKKEAGIATDKNRKQRRAASRNEAKETKRNAKKLETSEVIIANPNPKPPAIETGEKFIGTVAKPGTALRMRSNKKIAEQADAHKKRLKANKRKDKSKKDKKLHAMEAHPATSSSAKQKRPDTRDDLGNLIQKYKQMLEQPPVKMGAAPLVAKKPKRAKWYTE